MTDTTPRAGAPLLAANQAQKSVTHNEALYQFDALLCARFLDRDLTTPPTSPTDGDTYLIKPTATGAWTGQDGNIAYCADGVWRFYAPFAGLVAYVADECALVVFNGTAWVDYATLIALANIPMIGVNTTPDSTNKLAVQSNAALFTDLPSGSGGSGDMRVAVSKQAASNTASLLFQDNFSGRAEFGLTGDDDFHVKVSPDGSSWYEGLKIASASGLLTGTSATFSGNLTIDNANGQVPGALIIGNATHSNGAAIKLLGALGQHNWMIGHQINVTDVLEITPSTAAGGSTFTTPVVKIATTGVTIVEPDGASLLGISGATMGLRVETNSSRTTLSGVDTTLSGSYEPLMVNGSIVQCGIGGSEAARIDASGNWLVGRTSPFNQHSAIQVTDTGHIIDFVSAHASNPNGITIGYSPAAPNGTGNEALIFADSSATRLTVRSNGGIANYSANNVNLSDATAKAQIQPVAGNKALSDALWSAHKAIDWNRHKYADQTHDDWNYGYTAQGIANAFASVAPELVDTFDEKTKLLGVYHHDVTNIGGAVLAMAQTRIEAAEQKIARLEARLADLGKIAPRTPRA